MTEQLVQFVIDHGSSGGIVIVFALLYSGYRRLFSAAEESHDKRLSRLEGDFIAYRARAETERSRLETQIATINVLTLTEVIHMDEMTLGAINLALVAWFGLASKLAFQRDLAALAASPQS